MKEGFTFNKASRKFLRKFTSKNFGGGRENRKEPYFYSFEYKKLFYYNYSYP